MMPAFVLFRDTNDVSEIRVYSMDQIPHNSNER